MHADLLSPYEESAIRAAFRSTLGRVSQPLAEEGEKLLDHIPPQRWLLEWGLPLWLGESFGLSEETALTLALCNILGLTYVRVQDDLADGELAPALRPGLVALATVAFQQAIAQYALLFAGDERFWSALELRLGQWAQGLTSTARLTPGFTAHPDYQALYFLAHAGAPVHIGLVAACLLSKREDALSRLSGALEDWLLANVLLDHARDWLADLEAGRHNYFIAHTSPLPQEPDTREAIRRQMLELSYLGNGGQPYFDFVLKLLGDAQTAAQPAGCIRLNAYLAWFAGQVSVDLRDYRRQVIDRLQSTTKLLFGEA